MDAIGPDVLGNLHIPPGSAYGLGNKGLVVGGGISEAVESFLQPMRDLQVQLDAMKICDHRMAVQKFEQVHGRIPDFIVTDANLMAAQVEYMTQKTQAAKAYARIDQIVSDALGK